MASYEDQVRQATESAAAEQQPQCPVESGVNFALGITKSLGNVKAYPCSNALRTFAKQSKALRKMGVAMRPKAGQRPK